VCISYTREQQTIWASETLLPLSALVTYHYKPEKFFFLQCVGKYTFCFFTWCPCCTNFSSKTFHLVALQGFKIPWWPGCRMFSKCDDQKGLKILLFCQDNHTSSTYLIFAYNCSVFQCIWSNGSHFLIPLRKNGFG
jgi:hypothetical protein